MKAPKRITQHENYPASNINGSQKNYRNLMGTIWLYLPIDTQIDIFSLQMNEQLIKYFTHLN